MEMMRNGKFGVDTGPEDDMLNIIDLTHEVPCALRSFSLLRGASQCLATGISQRSAPATQLLMHDDGMDGSTAYKYFNLSRQSFSGHMSRIMPVCSVTEASHRIGRIMVDDELCRSFLQALYNPIAGPASPLHSPVLPEPYSSSFRRLQTTTG
jgi:hypothetical protein